MANTKISALPTWSGTAADLRWFVMNNSGQTETFKFSGYTSQLIPGTGTNSLRTINSVSSTNTNSIAIGNGASTTSVDGIHIGTSGTTSGVNSITIGEGQTNSGLRSVSIGYDTNVTANDCVVVGKIQSVPASNTIALGLNNGAGNGTYQVNISYDVNSFLNGGKSVGIGGGNFNQGGNYHVLIGHGNGNQGGTDMVQIGRDIQSNASYTNCIGIGENNDLNNNGTIILGHDITSTSPESVVIGGVSQTMSSTGFYNSIFNGSGNTISGSYSGVTMIGCSGRTASDSNTSYVENLKVFGQAQSTANNVGSVTGGTRTLNFNTGNIQYFQLTSGATVVLDATNYKDGATYIVKVQQPASGTNATMTYSSPLFKFPTGVAPILSTGNSNEDILTFICIGTTLYGSIVKTFI